MAKPQKVPTVPFTPSSPFDDLTADTILRSSDGVDFRVDRLVLSRASSFFNGMFSLPQTEAETDAPVISVSESGCVLDRFLRVWYPGADTVPAFEGLEDLNEILELALSKYDMQFLANSLKRHLELFTQTHCVGVFALACRYGCADVAKAAAKESLKLNFSALFTDKSSAPQLRHISADYFQALLGYHHACGLAAASAGRLLPWSDAQYAWIRCTICEAYSLEYDVTSLGRRVTPRTWIFQYLDEKAAILKDFPRASVQDPSSLVATQTKATNNCHDICRREGLRDLAKFIAEKYVPAINAAIEAVPLNLPF
ncbi:hypothetical protein K438DRAFT_2022272 [Mycena galopus ATCC 62051]|nr:hypothetical protein K438DRAFT_2022272 [Mycena galopus ATCC 62051]